MTITYAGTLPLTLALGASIIISATLPPVPQSSVTLTYDGTSASLAFDPAAIGNPSSAFLTVPDTAAVPVFAGLVTDARAVSVALEALDADIKKAFGISDVNAATLAGALVDSSLKAKP